MTWGVSVNGGTPIAGWFILANLIKMDFLMGSARAEFDRFSIDEANRNIVRSHGPTYAEPQASARCGAPSWRKQAASTHG